MDYLTLTQLDQVLVSVLDYLRNVLKSLTYFQIMDSSFLIYSYMNLLNQEVLNVERFNWEKMHTS